MKLLFEKSVPGRRGVKVAKSDVAMSINLHRNKFGNGTA